LHLNANVSDIRLRNLALNELEIDSPLGICATFIVAINPPLNFQLLLKSTYHHWRGDEHCCPRVYPRTSKMTSNSTGAPSGAPMFCGYDMGRWQQ
jgi:hypothetical protein